MVRPERALIATIGETIHAQTGSSIPVAANFFEAGLTSASIVTVHSGLQQVLDREFPVSVFFKYPTTRALAAFLANGAEAAPGPIEELQRAPVAWTAYARRELRAELRQRKG
jgi:acyl carrier protein